MTREKINAEIIKLDEERKALYATIDPRLWAIEKKREKLQKKCSHEWAANHGYLGCKVCGLTHITWASGGLV